MRSFMRVGGLACVLLTASAMAGAEVTDCTEIPGLPFDVKEPGIYCLKTSLSVSLPFGGAVDLGGFTSAAQGNIVEDVRAEGSSAIAIKVAGAGSVVRRNVVVRTG